MSRKFLSVIVLIFLALFLNSVSQAEEENIFKPCSDDLLRYFPKGKIEIIIGELVKTEELFSSCYFIPQGSSYDANAIITTVTKSPSSDVAEKVIKDWEVKSSKKPGVTILGKGRDICDQYIFGKDIGEDQDENDHFVIGQKSNFVFVVGSENLPQVNLNHLKDILRYACNQVSKASNLEPPSITPTPSALPPDEDTPKPIPRWLWGLWGRPLCGGTFTPLEEGIISFGLIGLILLIISLVSWLIILQKIKKLPHGEISRLPVIALRLKYALITLSIIELVIIGILVLSQVAFAVC